MFGKIKRFFIKFMIGMIDTVAVMELSMGEESGGVNLNGFLTFLIWLAVMFLLIKVNEYFSLVVALGVFLLLRVIFRGAESIYGYLCIFAVFAGMLLALKLFSHKWDKDIETGHKIDQNLKNGIACCPKCASTRVHFVQGHDDVHTSNEGRYDEDGFWIAHPVETTHYEGYWKCDNCGRTWR